MLDKNFVIISNGIRKCRTCISSTMYSSLGKPPDLPDSTGLTYHIWHFWIRQITWRLSFICKSPWPNFLSQPRLLFQYQHKSYRDLNYFWKLVYLCHPGDFYDQLKLKIRWNKQGRRYITLRSTLGSKNCNHFPVAYNFDMDFGLTPTEWSIYRIPRLLVITFQFPKHLYKVHRSCFPASDDQFFVPYKSCFNLVFSPIVDSCDVPLLPRSQLD